MSRGSVGFLYLSKVIVGHCRMSLAMTYFRPGHHPPVQWDDDYCAWLAVPARFSHPRGYYPKSVVVVRNYQVFEI